MKILFPAGLFILSLFLLSGNSMADPSAEPVESPITVHVRQAELARREAAGSLPVMQVTVDFINNSSTKKIDLVNEDIEYLLEDEFGNQYRQIEKNRSPWQNQTGQADKPYSSLYPGEQMTAVLSFEPPVEKSERMNLIISASMWGENGSVKLPLPAWKEISSSEKEVPEAAPLTAMPEVKPVVRSELPAESLRISRPRSGQRVKPGETVFVQVRLPDGTAAPDMIQLYSPDDVFEDPTAAMKYDVRIPAGQPPGPFAVLVVAVWGKDKVERTVSNSFTVEVIDAHEECLENCEHFLVENK